jgi:hypothetical protein
MNPRVSDVESGPYRAEDDAIYGPCGFLWVAYDAEEAINLAAAFNLAYATGRMAWEEDRRRRTEADARMRLEDQEFEDRIGGGNNADCD